MSENKGDTCPAAETAGLVDIPSANGWNVVVDSWGTRLWLYWGLLRGMIAAGTVLNEGDDIVGA